MTITQICAEVRPEVRSADRVPRSRNVTLAALVARLFGFMKRHRQIRESEALLSTFNDHVLADIGLRRDRIGPGVENADLLAHIGDGRIRLSRF